MDFRGFRECLGRGKSPIVKRIEANKFGKGLPKRRWAAVVPS